MCPALQSWDCSVNDRDFAYDVLRADNGTITTLIAYQERIGQAFRAVLWSVPRKQWIFAPAIAAGVLYDDDDPRQTETVDRQTAEQVAIDVLRAELPSVDALIVMSEEGERNGWNYGPPRS
jgi:hypothetical protein